MPALLMLILVAAPRAEKVAPVSQTSTQTYTLTVGGTTLQVGLRKAARVLSLKYQGAEILHVDSANGNMIWGSTFWPSPQGYWSASCKSSNNTGGFPPPTALDPNPYTGGPAGGAAGDTAVTFTGGADSYTHLRFRKTFSADAGDSSFSNRYTMVNTSASPITWAPWEDTRFKSGGISFFPSGTAAATGNAGMIKMTKDTLGTTWFKYDSAAYPVADPPKLFGDCGAAGWFAHVDKSRILFVKKFQDTPASKKAPTGESECEIYTANNKAYLEMELQGAYDPIPANDSVNWTVKWYVRKLPDAIAIGRNSELLAFVNQVLSGTSTAIRAAENTPSLRLDYARGSLQLDLPQAAELSLSLFDSHGREIAHLASGRFAAGVHSFPVGKIPPGSCWLAARDTRTGAIAFRRRLAGF
jgi:hypothetical protein